MPLLSTGSEIRCLGTCANPELIDAGSVVTPWVYGTNTYGSLSEAKRSRAAVSADVSAEHVPVPVHHTIRNQVSKDLRGGRKAWLPAGAGPAGLFRALRANLCASAPASFLPFPFLLFFFFPLFSSSLSFFRSFTPRVKLTSTQYVMTCSCDRCEGNTSPSAEVARLWLYSARVRP